MIYLCIKLAINNKCRIFLKLAQGNWKKLNGHWKVAKIYFSMLFKSCGISDEILFNCPSHRLKVRINTIEDEYIFRIWKYPTITS